MRRVRLVAALLCACLPWSSVHADGWDPGDDTGPGATALAPTAVLQSHGPHDIDGSVDFEDWYAIPMTAGQTYHFDSIGGTGDDYAVLYSDSGGVVWVVWDDNSGGGFQFSLDYTAAATQTYWLAVYTFGGACSGPLNYSVLSTSSSVRVAPANPYAGQPFAIVLSVTNTGAGDLTGLTPGLWFTSGGALAAPVSGPLPASVGTLAAGQNATFVWTFTATAAGFVELTASISGFGVAAGAPIAQSVATSFFVNDPARLEAGWTVIPASVTSGQTVQLILTVSNTGDFNATVVLPTLQFNTGGAWLTWISGPTPAGPSTVFANWRQSFTWIYQANGTGTGLVTFTGTAAGTDSATGGPVQAAAGGVVNVTTLRAAVSVSPRAPPPGSWVQLALTVTVAGASTVNGIMPEIVITSGASQVTFISGPSPAGPVSIGAGLAQTFVWTYSVNGGGIVTFTATATGVDSGSGSTVAASGSGSFPRRSILYYQPTTPAAYPALVPEADATSWSAAQWAGKTTADFASFDAIVFGNPFSEAGWATPIANRNVWTAALSGNMIVIGTDPNDHGKTQFTRQAILFAADHPAPGPGLYAELGDIGPAAPTQIQLLGAIGNFTVRDAGCWNVAHKISLHPVLGGITDAYLSGWGCSTHAGFDTWPAMFSPMALAIGAVTPFPYSACDGTSGMVYILASNVTSICAVPVLHLRVSPPGPVCAQDTLTYTLSWSNAGGNSILNATITDTIPAGVFYRSPTLSFFAQPDASGTPSLIDSSWATGLGGPWSPGEPPDMTPGPLALRWIVDRCAPGMSGNLTWQVTLDPALPAGSLVQSRGWATTLSDAGTWTTETTTNIKEEVRVVKTTDVTSVVSGGIVTYTLGFVNCTTTAYDLRLWDTIPADTMLLSATDSPALSGSVLSWSVAVVPSFATGSVSFTVSVTGPGAILGPNVAGMEFLNSLFVPRPALWTTPVPVAILRPVLGAIKRVMPSPARIAETVVYEIAVTNTGADTGTGLTVWDTLPPGLTLLSSTGGAWDGTKLDWTLSDLSPGASAVVSFTALITSTGWTVGPNTGAGVTASSLGWPQPQAVSPPVSLAVIRPAIALVKSSDVPFTVNGAAVTYTIGVFSTGTSTADTLEVWDSIPPGMAFTAANAGGVPAGAMVVWSLSPLAPGATMALTLTVAVTSTGWDLGPNIAEGDYSNGLGITGPRGASNPVLVPYNQPVIEIAKDASRMPAPQGSDLVFTLTLTNTGLDTAYAVSVWDSLPPGSIYGGCAGGLSCAWDGTKVLWSVPDMIPGAVVVLTVTVTADAGAGCPNMAEVSYGNSKGLAMPVALSTTVCVPVVNSDLRMLITVDRPVWSANEPVSYAVHVWNQGTDTAISITLSTTGVATTGVVGAWSATPTGTAAPGGHGWVLAPLPPGTGTTVWLSVLPVPPGCDPDLIWRWGFVAHENSAGIPQPDFPPGPLPVQAQLTGSRVSVWVDPAAPVVQRGATVTFTLSYSNPCSDTAWAGVLNAGIPSGLGFGSATAGGLSGGSGIVWGIAPVVPGVSGFVRFTVTATGPGPIQAPVLSSATFANGAGFPQSTTGGSATVYVIEPRLTITKRGPAESPALERFAYTILVTNAGDDTAFDIVIADTIPPPLGFASVTPVAARSGALVWWSVTRLGIGESVQAGLVVISTNAESDAAPVNLAQATYRSPLGIRAATPPDQWTVKLSPSLVVRVFPQPFDPAVSPLKITGVPKGATVRVYTLAGVEVTALSSGSGFRVLWDGRNAAGSDCAAGVYLYVIEPVATPSTAPVQRGKFGMIR